MRMNRMKKEDFVAVVSEGTHRAEDRAWWDGGGAGNTSSTVCT